MQTLEEAVGQYENTAVGNDDSWREFTALVETVPELRDHRDYIEANHLGFGDRAFHYMWKLLFEHVATTVARPRMLEIGVYKGQTISLWAMLASQRGTAVDLHAISPLEGSRNMNMWVVRARLHELRKIVSRRYRHQASVGNIYERADYPAIVRSLFAEFGCDFDRDVTLWRGLSTDPAIVAQARQHSYDLIYLDGDHTYDVVMADLETYAPLIRPGGYLVMDDAGVLLEGSAFWKGHGEVSQAAESVPGMGFENVLNVGHNRVFRKS